VTQDHFRQRVAVLLQLAEDVVRAAFSTDVKRSLLTDDKLAPRRFVAELSAVAKSERYLLGILLSDGAVYERHRESVRLEDFEDRIRVAGESKTGVVPPSLAPQTAMRIFTGAEVPSGADAVVMQEEVTREGDTAIFSKAPRPGQNIRRRGEDLATGAIGGFSDAGAPGTQSHGDHGSRGRPLSGGRRPASGGSGPMNGGRRT
jgi:hypothetical protein